MDVFKRYGLTEQKICEMVAAHLGVESIDAVKLGGFNALEGKNDYFMSNIQKHDLKAFTENGEGVATVKTLHLIIKTETTGLLQKVVTITKTLNPKMILKKLSPLHIDF